MLTHWVWGMEWMWKELGKREALVPTHYCITNKILLSPYHSNLKLRILFVNCMELQIKVLLATYAHSLGMGNGMNVKRVGEARSIGSNALLFHQQATTITLTQWSEKENFKIVKWPVLLIDSTQYSFHFPMRFLIIDHCALLSPSLTMHILSYNLHLKSRTMSKVAQQLVCYSKSCSDLFYGYFRYKLLIQSLKHS